MKTKISSLAAVVILITGVAPSFAQDAGTVTVQHYRSSRSALPIKIDGELDEPAWSEAAPIPLTFEWFPGDQIEPPVRTEAFVTYDDNNFYIAFKAYDPDPGAIRAHLMDRDSIDTFVQDDHITFSRSTYRFLEAALIQVSDTTSLCIVNRNIIFCYIFYPFKYSNTRRIIFSDTVITILDLIGIRSDYSN